MLTKFIQWTCVFALSAWTLNAQTATPPAPPTPPAVEHLRTFGMVGLAEGQTAQLNLLAPHVPATATTAACSAAVAFLDGQGNVLKSGTLTVVPDQSASFALNSDADLQMATDERREIRAIIQIAPVPPPAGSATLTAAPCRLIPTLEIFDNITMKTSVILTRAHFVREPAPAPAPTTNNPS
jgi:hypothetical protein